MDEEMIPLRTVREHYGIWRWKIERDSSNRLVKLWAEIGASNLDDETKVALANVAWALGSFERAYDILLEDIVRTETAQNTGVPASIRFLTGPYENSLEYLLGMSLWMDLADVLVSYRTIVDRFSHLRRAPRRKRISMSVLDIDREIGILRSRILPELSAEHVTTLANGLLHETWHPSGTRTLGFELYWKGTDTKRFDFAKADFRESLNGLVEDTIKQIYDFIFAVIRRHAPEH